MASNSEPQYAIPVRVIFPGTRQLALDGEILQAKSNWFRSKIGDVLKDGSKTITFGLVSATNAELPMLELWQDQASEPDIAVKLEKTEDDNSAAYTLQFADLYEALFDLICGKDFGIIKSVPISRLEILVAIADLYDTKSCVREGIKEYFLQYPKPLYEAIAQDPPRYLRFGFKCEWKFMYKQALIHCAGGFPGRIWPTPLNTLDGDLQAIVIEKAIHLADWARRVEVQLFMITFANTETGGHVSHKLGKGQRELINLFREWLVKELHAKAQDEYCYERGVLFWKMRKRGDAYLPLAQVEEHFKQEFGKAHHFKVSKYLSDLKDEVQRVVWHIADHKLDFVGREEYDIDYLTCLEVQDEDYLW